VKKTSEDFAMEMANYVLLDMPIPEDLIDNLMAGVCEEVKQEREGRKAGNDQGFMEGI
jgi:hypothetical protein